MYDNSGTVVLSAGGVALLGQATGLAVLMICVAVIFTISVVARILARFSR